MKKYLIVGNSASQTHSLRIYLEENNKDVNIDELYTKKNLLMKIKKNTNDLCFIDKLLRLLYSAELSLISYSYWHNAFEQKESRFLFFNFLFKCFAQLARKFPNLSFFFRTFIDGIRIKHRLTNFSYDAVFFTGILSTKKEIYYFYLCESHGVKKIYCPYNWDNPYSKLYIPTCKFDLGLSWGQHMTNWMEKCSGFKKIIEAPHPRLNYLQKIHEIRKDSSKSIILFALSQKPGRDFFNLLHIINSIFNMKQLKVTFIIRPHPFEPLNFEMLNEFKCHGLDVRIDEVYIRVLNEYGNNIVPGTFKRIQYELEISLHKMLSKALFVITEGSTLTAESLSIDIPVICLVNNYQNKTMRTLCHHFHFSPITNARKCLLLFTTEYASDRIESFLDENIFRSLNSNELYNAIPNIINLTNINNLKRYLNFEEK